MAWLRNWWRRRQERKRREELEVWRGVIACLKPKVDAWAKALEQHPRQ